MNSELGKVLPASAMMQCRDERKRAPASDCCPFSTALYGLRITVEDDRGAVSHFFIQQSGFIMLQCESSRSLLISILHQIVQDG
jgi:hypothetical protein